VRRTRGFTLIELMVAMAIAGILISLIFAVYTRMSVAYQAQNEISEVNQNLRAAQAKMVSELRLAGAGIPSADLYLHTNTSVYPDPSSPTSYGSVPPPITNLAPWNGLKVGDNLTFLGQAAGQPLRALYVTNGDSSTYEPDEYTIVFADHSKRLGIESMNYVGSPSRIEIVWRDGQTVPFVVDELVMLINPRLIPTAHDLDGDSIDETYDRTESESCLLQISKITPSSREIEAVMGGAYATINDSSSPHHCQAVVDHHLADSSRPISRTDTYLASFGLRAYRIDPSRRDIGVLQVRREARPGDSGFAVGTLFSEWQDLGIGFTNLQVATQWLEPRDTNDDDASADATVDPANDPERDWKSGENQETPRTWLATDETAGSPIRMTLTLEARSLGSISGVTTGGLPALHTSAAAKDTNPYGDLDALSLPNTDPRYDGNFILRRATISVELRSSAAGRW
jgi:prepilin-type N-terminal cleavage/methylation domain-containing protein